MRLLSVLLVLGSVGVSFSTASRAQVPTSAQTQTRQSQSKFATTAIVFGVGSPNLTAERSGTSIGVVVEGTLYVFDAGTGVERRIMEATPKLDALGVQKFGPVFISHLDRDHTIGLGALLMYHNLVRLPSPGGGPQMTLALRAGGGSFTVYGPGPVRGAHGIAGIMKNLEAAFINEVFSERIRVAELSSSALPFQSFDLKPGVVYKDAAVTVTAFEVDHKTPIAFGFRIQTADRVIVISGDTRPVDAVIEACNGCDLLFHELFGLDYGPGGPRGNAQGHTSAVELGVLAQRARPKRLVIYHDVNAPEEMALPLIKKVFSGEVTFARDLDVF